MAKGPAPGVYLWRGMRFKGERAVADAAGVNPRTVPYHLARYGNLDRLGAGRGRHKAHVTPKAPVPVRIDAIRREWPSKSALAREAGLPVRRVMHLLARGDFEPIIAALMAASIKEK